MSCCYWLAGANTDFLNIATFRNHQKRQASLWLWASAEPTLHVTLRVSHDRGGSSQPGGRGGLMKSVFWCRWQSDITASGELFSASYSCNPEDQWHRTTDPHSLPLPLALSHPWGGKEDLAACPITAWLASSPNSGEAERSRRVFLVSSLKVAMRRQTQGKVQLRASSPSLSASAETQN